MRLTGEHAIDVADASGTLLFDVAGRRWSEEVCGALEVPLEWLPPAYESTEIAGAGDQAAAALGVRHPSARPGLGRARHVGVVFAVLPAYAPDAEARVHVFCHAVPGTWHAMGVMLSAAGSAAWLRQALGADLQTLDAEAALLAPGAEGLLFAPYLAGERTPHADPDARGAFTGLSLRHDRGALARAMLEGVAYGLRDSLELLRSLGVEPEVGRVSGGGARSELWLRIVASVLGLPLERTDSEEGSAFGAALLAGVRAGVFADAADAVARCVRVRDRIEPDPAWAEAYEHGYERYRSLLPHPLPNGGTHMSLDGKTAVITGASRGIGAALARMLHERGVNLGLASPERRRPRARRRGGAAVRRPRPGRAHAPVRRDRRGIRRHRHRRRERGRRRVRPVPRPLARAPRRDDRREPKGTLYAIRAALPHMLGREGDVITLASEAGRRGLPLTRPSTARRSSARSASRARSTTSCASRASAARTSAPAASPPTSRSTTAAAGRPTRCPG